MTASIPSLEAIFDIIPAAFAVVDSEYRFVAVNQRHCDVVFTPREGLIGKCIFELFPETPERQKVVREAFDSALSGVAHQMPEVGYAIPAADGSVTDIYWSTNCVPIELGVCFGLHSQDVTAVVKARELTDAIAAELQHRVGNILTVIGATARQTARSYPQVKDFMPAFQGRLESIQITNAMLTGGNWDGLTFAQLVNRQLEPFKAMIGGQISVGGEDFRVGATEAQTLSMALHELLTNAQKYGALATEEGKLAVTYERIGKEGYQISWSETGLRDIKKPSRKGYGSTILNSLLPSQLGARVSQHFTETAHHFSIKVDAVAVAGADGA